MKNKNESINNLLTHVKLDCNKTLLNTKQIKI
jgi:hypothetical protein